MLTEEHIFTIKTKDAQNVANIQSVSTGVIISGLNVLKDKIQIGDLVFVVFGGDHPSWDTGLVGLALISKSPFDEGYDGKKNFRVGIDIKIYFDPITRGDLITYPDTFDTIGIGPITKWEPNQAITSVSVQNAIGLLQAIWDIRPVCRNSLVSLLGNEMELIPKQVRRFFESSSNLGSPQQSATGKNVNLQNEFKEWLTTVYVTPNGTPLGTKTVDAYVSFLDSVNKSDGKGTPCDQHMEQQWYNIYEYLYGKTTKDVFSIDTLAELDAVYGDLRKIVDSTNNEIPNGVIKGHYDIVKAWINSDKVKKSAWNKASFNRYEDFLKWREQQTPPQAPLQPTSSAQASATIAKVGQTPINDFSDFIKQLEDDIRGAGLVYAEGLMRRFVCAQLAKPFVVLTGLSGSGKTKLAQAFTEWIAVENTAKIVPVGADWTNSEHLLGYPDALQPGKYVMPETDVLKLMLDARDNPKLPFFLILDEMNLSHVERYFADFLSAMESGEDIKLHGDDKRSADGIEIPQTLKFPKNLFIIGTMNVDETTYMFSPKVLDRAQVIEFKVEKEEMEAYLANPPSPNLTAIKGKGAKYAEAFCSLKDAQPSLDGAGSTTNKDAIAAALNKFFPELADLGAEFGYRSAGEIMRFCAYYLAAGATIDNAIDAAIVQKLLPKLHGSQARLGPVLRKLKELATKETVTSEGGETKKVRTPLYALTCDKLDRMLDRLKANGFTSFAEA